MTGLSTLKKWQSNQVKLETLVPFYKRMATMFTASIPILDVLGSQRNTGDPALDRVVEALYMDVASGHYLSTAMASHEETFGPLALGLVKAGEESGSLAKVMQKLSDLSEQALRLKRSVLAALTYPAVLCATTLGMGLLFATVICSQDEAIFGKDREGLPWPTQILVNISDLVSNPLLVGFAILAVIGSIGFWRHSLRHDEEFLLKYHTLALHSPVVGGILRSLNGARVIYVLGLCLEVGIGLVQALAITERIVGNKAVSAKLGQVRRDVADGNRLAESLDRQSLFPPIVVSMAEVGEETGGLSKVLGRLSETLETDVNDALQAFAQVIEPVLLISVGGFSMFVAFAALAPMFQLLQSL